MYYLCAYEGGGDDGYAVVIKVTGSGTISRETPLEFDTNKGKTPAMAQIDDFHHLCAYSGEGDDGWAAVLSVNSSSKVITKETPFEFDISKGEYPALCQIDSTHYLCAYEGDGDDGWAVVLTVNSGNWTITGGTPFEYDTTSGREPAVSKVDDTHYLCVYRGPGDDGYAVILGLTSPVLP